MTYQNFIFIILFIIVSLQNNTQMTLDKIENIVKNNIRESNSLEFKHANAL